MSQDLICTLEDLPGISALLGSLEEKRGIIIRHPTLMEQEGLKQYVRTSFNGNWAQEVAVAFYRQPISCFVATCQGAFVGFAAYECTRRGYFGPMGVDEVFRGKGVGLALLFSCLCELRNLGYAYAIIGGAGPKEFYSKACGAMAVPCQEALGIYRLKREPKFMQGADLPPPTDWPSLANQAEQPRTSASPPDMFCSLVRLPKVEPILDFLQEKNIDVRRPNPWEQDKLKAFVEQCGKPEVWQASAVAFARRPITCFVAMHEDQVVGIATYECTRGYVNNILTADNMHPGVAMVLLFSCLHGLQDRGYTYATITRPHCQKFFEKACQAVPLTFTNVLTSSRALLTKYVSPSLRPPAPFQPLAAHLPRPAEGPSRPKKAKLTPCRANAPPANATPPDRTPNDRTLNDRTLIDRTLIDGTLNATVTPPARPPTLPDSAEGSNHGNKEVVLTPLSVSKIECDMSEANGEEEEDEEGLGEGAMGLPLVVGSNGLANGGSTSGGKGGQGGPGKMKRCSACKQFRGQVPHPRKGACPYCLVCLQDTRTVEHLPGTVCPFASANAAAFVQQ